MPFKVDENLPAEIADMLRSAGYDAVSVIDQHQTFVPTRLTNSQVWSFSVRVLKESRRYCRSWKN